MRKYAIVVLVALFALGCEVRGEFSRGPKAEPKPGIWIGLNNAVKNPGPYVYKTVKPIELPDGSQVVCVATNTAMWCRDAK